MFHRTCWLARKQPRHFRRTAKFLMKSRGRNSPFDVNNQLLKAKEDRINRVMAVKGMDRDPATRAAVEKDLYGTTKYGKFLIDQRRTGLVQGLGDETPLGQKLENEMSNLERFGVEDFGESPLRSEAIPYDRAVARRLAKGQMWPTAPEENSRTFVPKVLENEESSSPATNRFAAKVEYHIRRSLRAIPAHLGEQLDFTQIVIDRVYLNRNRKKLFVVWSTVDPSFRYQLEPHMNQLGPWVRNLIRNKVSRPIGYPQVYFVYNTGAIPEALPRALHKEVKDAEEMAQESIEDRLAKIKTMDSLEHRMKSVPWFMPYLWAKDKRQEDEVKMRTDYAELKKRKSVGQHQYTKTPAYVR